MATKLEAKLLEKQGYFVDAYKIYKSLDDKESLKKYDGINVKLLEFFVRMKKRSDYEKFKRWLYRWS